MKNNSKVNEMPARKVIDFMSHRKTFWLISISIIVVGILFNLIFGVSLDIQFTGGSIFKYSFADESVELSDTDVSPADLVIVTTTDVLGAVDENDAFGIAPAPADGEATVGNTIDLIASAADVSAADVSAADTGFDFSSIVPDYSRNVNETEAAKVISAALGEDVEVAINSRININEGEKDNKNLIITLAEKKALGEDASSIIVKAMQAKYPNVKLTLKESSSVNPTMGKEFFWKCIVAVLLASAFMVLYVGLRFRKIGGWTAGASGIIAILHDCLVVYFVFVICGFPIDDNFIAVILAIIGYSLNSTIVIFDRIRENRKLLGPKVPVADLANISMTETLGRTINTNLCVFASIAIVAIVSVIFKLDSIMSFAVPMMFGTVSGCYSSLCISNSLWVTWQESIEKKKAENASGKKSR